MTPGRFDGFSLRYGRGGMDLRTWVLRALAAAQRRKVLFLHSDPELCAAVLAASDTKGNFLEALIATPAWSPIYSIESVDGELWKQLSSDFKTVLARMRWRERLPGLVAEQLGHLRAARDVDAAWVLDSPKLAKSVASIMFGLVFERPMSASDASLFYAASLEWRREIAVKNAGDTRVKQTFWRRLHELVASSSFKEGLETYEADPAAWLSVFAQPFLISPAINVGDIFVAVFAALDRDAALAARVRLWAQQDDRARIEGLLLEAIRLRHPFPMLERELQRDLNAHGTHIAAGTQVFISLDTFEQDQRVDPERWLKSPKSNPYHAIPFAAGPRMCIGKPVAMELMASLLVALLRDFPLHQLKPAQGHLYSGRGNDGSSSLSETAYQLKVFAGALRRSIAIGRARKGPADTRA